MPVLQNPKHETFARKRAAGVRLMDAFEDAGFVPDSGHASRLAQRKEVGERIAELRAEQIDISEASTHQVIAALLRIAKANETTGAAGAKEARLTLIEARRLSEILMRERDAARPLWLQERVINPKQ